MGRPSKGARLYLRKGRIDPATGRKLAAIYFIRDGQKNLSTGCGPERIEEAQRALSDYLDSKFAPPPVPEDGASPPSSVLVAEVVALYARERGPETADPGSVKVRLEAIMRWWGDKSLADITRSNCKAYVAARMREPIRSFKDPKKARTVTAAAAGRELEDLSAAITWWDDEHPLTRKPSVTLPPKKESPRDALSRAQAAALLKAARGWRLTDGAWIRTARSTASNRRHLPRFLLLGLYTGTRPGVLPKLRWSASSDAAWVDLDGGWIYRRGRDERDTPTKRRPMIRIPRRLLAHLKRWHALDMKANVKRREEGLAPLTTVLHHGGRALAGRIRKGYSGIVADAGLDPDITPHWHRHTAASWLMEDESVPLPRVAQYLGMSVPTLIKHYGHHRPEFQNDAGDALTKGGRARR